MAITRKCTKCDKVKLISEFHKQKRGKYGVGSWCKVCTNKYSKAYNAIPENKKRKSERNKAYYAKPENKKRKSKQGKIYRAIPKIRKRDSERHKAYRAKPENKKRKKEYVNEYYAKSKNKEHRKKYGKAYRAKPENKKRKREWSKKYNARPKVKKRIKKYRKVYDTRPETKKRKDRQRKEPMPRYRRYKARAKEKDIDFNLSLENFIKITNQPCHYCGEFKDRKGKDRKGKFNGIDRMDNSRGYTKENSFSCCELCNRMKGALDLYDFIPHLEKIVNRNREKVEKLRISRTKL